MILYLIILVSFGLLGYGIGLKRGFSLGVKIGADIEFGLMAGAIKKLTVQTRYEDLMQDLQKGYQKELNFLKESVDNEG